MQYGNFIYADSISCNALCLNRTMQYGNYYTKKKKNTGYKSLNRTMQYGNIEAMTDARAKKKV